MDASSTGKSWNTDWTKCCLYQEVKKEDLKSPQANPARRGDNGYMNLATNIPLFHSLNALPIKLDPARLDIMRVAGFYLTTQSYTAEKDQ